ncbi:stealth family protein [Streptomyces sp. ME19-01-6]|uniref:stealth family protein n=1 Tax=Streptomyces sp. ME19-01-6 TaxID=3028686 RepID=UPI0029B661F7|nr:stealth family protein [Streptomyces sp. ME19-01-6]MDX3232830.1 stealth family protein [Streptomyces sp. ME19-01-6]
MPRTAPPAPHLPWHADVPPVVRRYRRRVPLHIRRAVVAVTGAGLRRAAMRGLGRLSAASGTLRARWGRRRLRRAGLLAAPDRIVVADRHGPRVAQVTTVPTPLHARAENLRLVCEALEQAGIDHFVVRAYGNVSSAVGVPAEERPRVVAALTELCAREAGYVSLPTRGKRPGTVPRPGRTARAWRRLSAAPVVRFTRFCASPGAGAGAGLVLGVAHGCDIEFWRRGTADEGVGGEGAVGVGDEGAGGDLLLAPRPNRTTAFVPAACAAVHAPGHLFTRLAPAEGWQAGPLVRTRPEFTPRLPDEVRFPIDVVYTWVDGADPAWRRRRAEWTPDADDAAGPYHEQAANEARYANRDELRYSLRSLHMYAPWVRHIYLVTDDQVPPWLVSSHPGITVVDHRDIFDDPRVLPTFNSQAIETRLHHIDGLAEHFLYFNDDVFLGSPVTPQDFFLASGVTKFFLSRALIPLGPAHPGDVPVSAAGKNNRALLEGRFGATVTQKLKHTPHALRRSVLAEIEREFPGPYRATMASRVRSASDISLPSALHHYYAFLTGRAVPAPLRYDYFDLARPGIPARLARLLRSRQCQAFCLNDTVSCERDLADQLALLRPFLDAYFPVPSPLERAIARQEVRQPCPSPSPSR